MQSKTHLYSICVYCGSSPGANSAYVEAAAELAAVFHARQIQLIYGGASIGVMGAVADGMLAVGGEVIGVIPEGIKDKEVGHQNLTQLHVTSDMHQRKAMMAGLSDAFIALPGGLGTLEELFEIWTWSQLGFHDKPFGLLNVAGYYDGLLSFLDHAVAEAFIQQTHRELLICETSPETLVERLLATLNTAG